MVDFSKFLQTKPATDSQPHGWPAAAFEEDSYALVACGLGNESILLDYEGAHLDAEIDAVSCNPSDLGIEAPEQGLWVWTGKYIGHWSHTVDGSEYDSEPSGTWREATLEEVTAYFEGRNVFPRSRFHSND